MIKTKSIYQLIVYSIIFVIVLISFFTFIIIDNAFDDFQEKITIIKKDHLKKQKDFIKNEINSKLSFIKYSHDKYKNIKTNEEIQEEVLNALYQMRNTSDQNEYTFIYKFDGTRIYYPLESRSIGEKFYEFTDSNGIKVVKELIDISQKNRGGFVEYIWYKPKKKKTAPKISYAKSYEPWGWTIGQGVYLDTVDSIVQIKRLEYDEKIEDYVLQIISMTILLLLYSIFIYKNASILIANEVKEIGKYFIESQKEDKPVNQNKILFTEFRMIVKYANEAMSNIKYKSGVLEDLNKSLEKKVEGKTQELTLLLDAQKEFLKNAIHEINTPLSIIQTNIDLLRMHKVQNKYITNIESGSKIINNIFDDLSFMIKKNRVDYKKTRIDFSTYIKDRLDFFDEIAQSNSLFFVTNIQDNIFFDFNITQLQRVLDNNLSNAIKYSYKESPIFVKLTREREIITFEVKTNSKTILNTNKIFDDFYRENKARGGFGLGLRIVKDICDENFVKIELISQNEETKFTYRFNADENITT